LSLIEFSFFVVLLCVVNNYFIYPLVIITISIFRNNAYNNSEYEPAVSILISAYNEEKVIRERISNIENQNYNFSKLEVLIGSDCSIDNTNKILEELSISRDWLKVFVFEKRQGKAAVINNLIKHAQNEILVFTDANTKFNPDAIRKLVSPYVNSKIGGVCGKLVLTENESNLSEGVEEKKYWLLETFLKKAEGKLGILIGANGGIFSIRKELFSCIPIDKAVTDDFFLSLSVLQKDFDFIYVENAIAFEQVAKNIKQEFNRKVRFIATNFQTLSFFKNLILKKGFLISYAFLSHKVLRWFLPIQLILIFCFNLILINAHSFYIYTLLFQIVLYFFGLIGFLLSKVKVRLFIFSLPYFFIITNIALLFGMIRFLRKRHSVIWESTMRY